MIDASTAQVNSSLLRLNIAPDSWSPCCIADIPRGQPSTRIRSFLKSASDLWDILRPVLRSDTLLKELTVVGFAAGRSRNL